MRRYGSVVVAAALMAGCGSGTKSAPASNAATAAKAPETPPAIGANGRPICPANGSWSACSIMERLDRAGLAPRRDSTAAHEDGLSFPGILIHLGNSDLEVFIYADSAGRRADEAQLDRKKFIEATQEPTLAGERTLIRSANLLAILNSRNDHQRERVSDAITAGPPQP